MADLTQNDNNIEQNPVTSKPAGSTGSNPNGVSELTPLGTYTVGSGKKKQTLPVTTPTGASVRQSSQFQNQLGNTSTIDIGDSTFKTQYGSDYFDSKWMGISTGPVDSSTSNTRAGLSTKSANVDFEHLRRNSQSTLGASANLLTQFVGKTVVNTVGGVVGGFYSLGSAIVNADASKLYDNSVNRALDKATEWVDTSNSVFTSNKARESQSALNLFNVEGAKNLSDGLSFVAGAVLSTYLTGGLGATTAAQTGSRLVGNAAKLATSRVGVFAGLKNWGDAIKKAQQITSLLDETNNASRMMSVAERSTKLRQLLKLGDGASDITGNINALRTQADAIKSVSSAWGGFRSTVTGSFWEAGLEARQTKDAFIQANLDSENYRIDAMNVSEEEKKILKSKAKDQVEQLGESAGLLTFGLNVTALTASNKIQFPTLFNPAAKIKPGAFNNSFVRDVAGQAYKLPKNVKMSDALRYFGAIIKNPIAEGSEEILQGVISGATQDYYTDRFKAETSSGLLNDQVNGVINDPSWFKSAGKYLSDNYKEKEFWQEGVIGAVMGAMGIPVLKRNKAGKLRSLKMQGGIWEDIGNTTKYRNQRGEALAGLNSMKGDINNSITAYNTVSAKMAEMQNRKDDVATLTNSDIDLEINQNDKLFRTIFDAKSKGIDSYLDESIEEIHKLSDEEYRSRFDLPAEYSKEEIAKDKARFKDDHQRINKAYDLVYNNLEMDKVEANSNSAKMFEMLTHAVAFEEYSDNKIANSLDKIVNNEFWDTTEFSEDEINELSSLTAEYETAHSNYDAEIKAKVRLEQKAIADEINAADKEFNEIISGLNVLPEIKGRIGGIVNSINEALVKGDTSEATAFTNQLNDELEALDTKTDTTVKDNIKKLVENRLSASKKLETYNAKSLFEKYKNEDSEDNANFKKELKDQIDTINAAIKESHEKDVKLVKTDPKTIKLDEVLRMIELNKRFKLASKKAKAAKLKGVKLSDKFQKESLDIDNEIRNINVLQRKKLAALNMANTLMGVNQTIGYRNIALMNIDTNMQELLFQLHNVESNYDKLNTAEEDLLIVDVIHFEQTVNTVDKLIEEAEEEFNLVGVEIENYKNIVKDARAFINEINEGIKLQDYKNEVAKQQSTKEVQAKTMGSANDAAKEAKKNKKVVDKNSADYIPEGFSTRHVNLMTGEVYYMKSDGTKMYANELEEFEADKAETIKEQEEFDKIVEIVTETVKTPFVTKKQLTVYPLNSEGSKGFGELTLSESISQGKIKYNQASTLQVAENELDDPGFIAYLNGLGVDNAVDLYKAGKLSVEKMIENEDPLLQENYHKLPLDVIFYIENARINFTIYNTGVRIDKYGKQIQDTTDADVAHEMYLPAPGINFSKEKLDATIAKYEAKLVEVERLHEERLNEINSDESLSAIEKNSYILIALDDLASEKKDINERFNKEGGDQNAYTNFELRRLAVTNMLNPDKENLVELRIGNFLNGVIQKANSTESGLVDNYSLNDEENGLINEQNQLVPEQFAFGNQSGALVSFSDSSVTKINEGSFLSKHPGQTNHIYYLYKSNNGQVYPVHLNRNEFSLAIEGFSDNFSEHLAAYFRLNKESADRPNQIIEMTEFDKANMPFVAGLTYKEFFEMFLPRYKSKYATVASDSANTLDMRADGVIQVGGLQISTIEDYTSNESFIKTIFDTARVFVNKKHFSNEDSGLSEYAEFLLNNGLLTSTLETSKNRDKIFAITENETEDYVPGFQLHVLNTDISEVTNVPKKKSNTQERLDLISKVMLGSKKAQASSVTQKQVIGAFISSIYRKINFSKEYTVEEVRQEIIDAYDTKINSVRELIETYIGISTPFSRDLVNGVYKDFNEASKALEKIKSTEPIDLYLKTFLKATGYLYRSTNPMKILKAKNSNDNSESNLMELLINKSETITGLGGVNVNGSNIEGVNTNLASVKKAKDLYEESFNEEDETVLEKLEADRMIAAEAGKRQVQNLVSAAKKLADDIEVLYDNKSKSNSFKSKTGKGYIAPQDRIYINVSVAKLNSEKKTKDKDGNVIKTESVPYANKYSYSTSKYKYDPENKTFTVNSEGVKSKKGDHFLVYYSEKSDKAKTTPFEFKVLRGDKMVITDNPDVDFKYDENTGELLNGLVTVNLGRQTKDNEGKDIISPDRYTLLQGKNVTMANRGLKDGGVYIVNSINLPGLDGDNLELNDDYNKLGNVSSDYNNNIKIYNAARDKALEKEDYKIEIPNVEYGLRTTEVKVPVAEEINIKANLAPDNTDKDAVDIENRNKAMYDDMAASLGASQEEGPTVEEPTFEPEGFSGPDFGADFSPENIQYSNIVTEEGGESSEIDNDKPTFDPDEKVIDIGALLGIESDTADINIEESNTADIIPMGKVKTESTINRLNNNQVVVLESLLKGIDLSNSPVRIINGLKSISNKIITDVNINLGDKQNYINFANEIINNYKGDNVQGLKKALIKWGNTDYNLDLTEEDFNCK